jgi:AcrR family transcriptional regulator
VTSKSPEELLLPARPPKQERSRLTLHRLLSAAEALLNEGGLDAATVPNIAEAAGVSVGVVYRRFPDKDALLRAVYERFFEKMEAQNRASLQAVWQMKLPLTAMVRGMVVGMVDAYRRHRRLFRALRRFAAEHPDPKFRHHAQLVNAQALNGIATLMLTHRNRIRHPDPETAIRFGLLCVASTLQAVVVEEEPLHGIPAPANLEEELIRMLLGYLGIAEAPRRKRS